MGWSPRGVGEVKGAARCLSRACMKWRIDKGQRDRLWVWIRVRFSFKYLDYLLVTNRNHLINGFS